MILTLQKLYGCDFELSTAELKIIIMMMKQKLIVKVEEKRCF